MGPGGDAAEGGRENGDASTEIEEYRGSSLAVRVAARADALVATSIPAWPGWRATLDGRSIEPIEYNVAFLSYRVPPGDHRLVLRYLPRSVVWGGVVGLLTLVVCGVLLVVSPFGPMPDR